MILKVISMTVSLLFGIALAFFLNYSIIEQLVIPDPCAYHGEITSRTFDLFYKMDGRDGFHPSPTWFNSGLTVIAGCIGGYLFYRYGKSLIVSDQTSKA